MSKILTSTVSVDFSSKAAELRILIEADDRDPYSLRTQYLRVYPKNIGVLWESSGQLVRVGNSVEDVTDILSFSNSNQVVLPYPEASNVSIALLGSFHDVAGNRTTTSLSFNSNTNSIESSVTGFAVLQVSYKAKYTLYKFLYEGWGCPYEPDYSGPPSSQSIYNPFGQEAEKYIPYIDAVIVVYDAPTGDFATITLDAPDCSYKKAAMDRDSGVGKLVLEVDTETPVAIAPYEAYGIGVTNALAANTVIRVYPDVDVKIKANTGTLYPVLKNESMDITEPLNFQSVNGMNVKYPPVNRMGIVADPPIYDQWNNPITAMFKQEGDVVKEVEWTGPNEYTGDPQDRIIQPGEIVATDSQSRVVKITGIVQVTYSTTYRLYPYKFSASIDNSGKVEKFKDAIITASYQKPPTQINRKQIGSLRLTGPSLKGADSYKAPDGS